MKYYYALGFESQIGIRIGLNGNDATKHIIATLVRPFYRLKIEKILTVLLNSWIERLNSKDNNFFMFMICIV